MNNEEIQALMSQLKDAGLSEEDIANGVLWPLFQNGKMSKEDLATLCSALGLELDEDFEKDEGPEAPGITKEEAEEAKEIQPGESKEEFKEKLEEAKGDEPAPIEAKSEEKEEVEDKAEDGKSEDEEWEEAKKLFKL